jgi:drug/metabolite transporter (DMT)-like permease
MDPVAQPRDHGDEVAAKDRVVGIAFAFVSALSQAVGILLAHKAMQGQEVLPVTVWRLLGGIALAVPIALVLGRSKGVRARPALAELTRPLRSKGLFLMLMVPTFVATIMCLPLHSFAVRGAPSGLSALVLSTSPLFILPLGRFFHARHGWLSVVGTLIGFAGLAGVLLL